MENKLNKAFRYFLDRLGEQSTWQGIGFIACLFFGKYLGGLDWGQAAGLGGAISASIKMLLPDVKE